MTTKKSNYYLDRIFRTGRKNLKRSEKALAYLASRGVDDTQIQDLGLAYFAENEWPPYLDIEEATDDELLYWDKSRKGSKLKGKVLFPMTNAMGMTKAFQIRSPDPEVKDYWKYYSLRANVDALFFGTNVAMPHIWETREVYLVEGIFDLFPVQRLFPNTICTGTAEVSEEQLTFLLRHVDRVRVLFDNDEYGNRFFDKFYRTYRDKFDLIDRPPYGGKDPSSSWERLGEKGFRAQFERELDMMTLSTPRGTSGPLFT